MGLDPALELRCRPKEIPRDRDHRVLGTMMREKLTAALKEQRGEASIRAFFQFLFYFFKFYMASREVTFRRSFGISYLNSCAKIIL